MQFLYKRKGLYSTFYFLSSVCNEIQDPGPACEFLQCGLMSNEHFQEGVTHQANAHQLITYYSFCHVEAWRGVSQNIHRNETPQEELEITFLCSVALSTHTPPTRTHLHHLWRCSFASRWGMLDFCPHTHSHTQITKLNITSEVPLLSMCCWGRSVFFLLHHHHTVWVNI